jgi:hypothetical protein
MWAAFDCPSGYIGSLSGLVPVASVQSLCAAAAREHGRQGGACPYTVPELVAAWTEGQNYEPNAALIVNAPTDIAALLAEVARLTAEVERLSAMVPRWAYTHRGRMWRLYCCGVRLLDSGLSAFPGELVLDTTTGDEYPDLPTACRSVCARLGLHDIKPPEGA